MDCVFLLIAHWTSGRDNEVMAPSYGLLDLTVWPAGVLGGRWPDRCDPGRGRRRQALLGRRTYEICAGCWPTAPREFYFTGLMNRIPKYVASRTLTAPLDWVGASLLEGDLADAATVLKVRHDEVHVIGSLDLVQSLLRLGLVDRLQMWVYPVVLGKGKRLFDSGTVPAALRLVDSAVFPNGRLKLDFATAGEPKFGNVGNPEKGLRRMT